MAFVVGPKSFYLVRFILPLVLLCIMGGGGLLLLNHKLERSKIGQPPSDHEFR